MSLIDDALHFLDKFTSKVGDTGIDVSKFNLDHVAYQASSSEDYEAREPKFEKVCKYKHEAFVGGRRVGVYALKKPIKYKGNMIIALELIEPKDGVTCASSWEHAEYVINEPFEKFIKKYPKLNWDTSSIERHAYSHLKLRLDESTQLKFHLLDILETIKEEEK